MQHNGDAGEAVKSGIPSDLTFDIYSGADRESVLDLMRAFYVEDGHDFIAEIAERGLIQLEQLDALAGLWVLRRRGETRGYICITYGFSLEVGGLDFFIDELFVVPDARGAGVGLRALDFAERESRARGAMRLVLEVERENQRARDLYLQRGYAAHGRHLMSKLLA